LSSHKFNTRVNQIQSKKTTEQKGTPSFAKVSPGKREVSKGTK
jgi:hypothetical protein